MKTFKIASSIVKLSLMLIVLTLFAACSQQVVTTGFWANKEIKKDPTQKIYIISLGQQVMNNAIVENDFYTEANRRGIKTVKNVLISPKLLSTQVVSKEEIMKNVTEQGCDAIFTIALVDVQDNSRYVPGNVSVGMSYNPGMYNGYYNNFYGYYNNYYAVTSTPGYYVNEKTYFIECNLFDVKSEQLLFSIQSKTTNPTDIESVSKAYVREIFKKLETEKVIKVQ
jgi:hypothetical protein